MRRKGISESLCSRPGNLTVQSSMLSGHTRLNKDTKDIVFFVLSVPGISADDVQEGVETVRNLFKAACTEIDAQVHENQSQETLNLIVKEP